MLEIQLPAIYRARSTEPTAAQDPPIDDGSGLPEDHVLTASVRRLRTFPPAPPIDEGDLGVAASLVPVDDAVVSIDDLLVWVRTEERRPIDTRLARLASLLGIAAVAIVVLILVFAAGTDIASMFRSLPGS